MAGMMAPEVAIDALQTVPYVAGRGDWLAADCWGVVELWYRHILGIELMDRSNHPAGHEGMQSGFDCAADWSEIDDPVDHCLVIMRAGRIVAGHVGIHFAGSVLHSDESHGCVYEPINGRFIRTRITGYLERK